MGEFITRTLGQICDEVKGVIRTGPFGSQLHQANYKAQGIPVVMPKDIVDGKVSDADIARIGSEDYDRLSDHRLFIGDIVYARRGDVGRRALIRAVEAGWLCGTGSLRISLGTSVVDPVFLYYFLGLPSTVAWIQKQAIGATMPNLNTSIVRNIKVSYPPLHHQRKIASILSAYDDLIENNTRRIRILEQMAQAIYQEWFVRFRFPGHEGVRMVETEQGVLPEGWEVTCLRNVTSYINRGISPKYDDEAEFLVLNQKCIRENKINISLARSHRGTYSQDKGIRLGDVLINSTGIGTLGRVAQVYQELLNYTVDSHVTIARPNDQVGLDYFGYSIMGLQDYFDHMGAGATGQTELAREVVANTKILLAPPDLQIEFGLVVSPMRKMMINLQVSNTTLKSSRDLLLPRLISGELSTDF